MFEKVENNQGQMLEKSRTYNSIRNIFFGIGSQIIVLFLNFLSRTIFIKVLGTEYLGINGLFSNILTVLSLAELGIGNAIIYSLYKPLAEKDENKISAIMNLYRKVYNVIAISILIIGLLIIPILKYIVNSNIEMNKIILFYLLYLLNSVISYLFVSRTSILNADQKMYIIKRYTVCFLIFQVIIQIIVLYIFKSFELYLIIQILFTLLTNLYGALKVRNLYPFISRKNELEKEMKKDIFSNMKSMFLYKIGGVILNNTDNILISIMISTAAVGYYSNYYMVISAITAFTSIIFSALTGSIGNLNAVESEKKQYNVFKILNFVSAVIYGMISISLIILYNDFIKLWIGKEYIIDYGTISAIVLNFYLIGRLTPVSTYRETLGMFKKTKYIFMITAIINIILSIILGNIYGMFGIIIATAISRIITNRWYEPYILYKDYFKVNIKKYWIKNLIFILMTIINFIIVYYLLRRIEVVNILQFMFKAMLCCIILICLYIIEFRNTYEYKYIKNNIAKKLIKS